MRQSRCPKSVIHCNYKCIDIDFLFNFEFDDDKSLSSLAINSNHRLLLQSIQVGWFGSKAVGSTTRERRQSASEAASKFKEQHSLPNDVAESTSAITINQNKSTVGTLFSSDLGVFCASSYELVKKRELRIFWRGI